jgi:hypothetical protein
MNAVRMPGRWRFALASLLAALAASAAGADVPVPPESFESLAAEFSSGVRPLVQQFCLECHATDSVESDLDLEQLATFDDVRRATRKWIKVAERLDTGEMPPKDAPRPSTEQRRRLRSWVERYLRAEAYTSAGDPGPVVLRRLSNAQYTYTIDDLTGLDLKPAREFPTDSAAGEGFTNTGNALVMSPALLTKYLDAGKMIASHAVLLQDGLRFSTGTSRRDWTDEAVTRIRTFYRAFTDNGGGTQVNLQGIVFGTNEGGRLPLEKYLAATLVERQALADGTKTVEALARQRGLSPKYLRILWTTLALDGQDPSPLLDRLREQWRGAGPGADDAAALAAEIARWQKALWRFTSVGQIGKVGGPKAWMEPVTPLAARQDVRLGIPAPAGRNDVTLYLAAGDAGDGSAHDLVVWERPRLIVPGQPDLTLRELPDLGRTLAAQRQHVLTSTARCLRAAAEATTRHDRPDLAQLARSQNVDPDLLGAWLDYLGLGIGAGPLIIDSHLTERITRVSDYDFVNGWGSAKTPSVVANSSSRPVRIPGNLKPHGIALHPSPSLRVAAGWRSPAAALVRLEAKVQDAHLECGNGATWSLELRRGDMRQRLAAGMTQGAEESAIGPIENLAVEPGDFVSLLIGPRDGNHKCDLTAVDLWITGGDPGQRWDLAGDVAPDILAGNPHADGHGNPGVWHFYTEPDRGGDNEVVFPASSLLAKWQSAAGTEERQRLADQVQDLLESGPPAAKDAPDVLLYRQLTSLRGPLVRAARRALASKPAGALADSNQGQPAWGLDPAWFGRQPDGQAIDASSLCVRAPSLIEVRLPASLVEGCEFVTSGTVHAESGAAGSVQLQVHTAKPAPGWSAGVTPDLPIVARDGSAARRRIERAFDRFRALFPPALCYTRIVPVDEVITLTLYYREDDHLRRLMLDDAQARELDRLWDELHFISQDALTRVDAYQQLMEYATQDGDPRVLQPLGGPILEQAETFRKTLIDAEPRHLDAVVEFAFRAQRRPLTLTGAETERLRGLYRKLRDEEIPHDEAVRLTLASVLIAPAFLYRLETPGPGTAPAPVSDWELASRLSYFLWSSLPDAELRALASAGRLRDPRELAAQARRMLHDGKIRRLATEFACQWLHVYDFDTLDEKSERHFPTFAALRGAMYEETIRFFTDVFQHDASVLRIFDADHTFLNEALARHYGIPGVTGSEWQRVDGVRTYGRGGILALATTLAKQSGASRTSPILRGNWVSEVLLGERLPRPPKDVPQLPEDEVDSGGQTVRQLVEQHSRDVRCAGCHRRIDPLGYALEGFDAIGRRRQRDLADRPVDVHAQLQDGAAFDDVDGLRQYLLTTRRDAVLRQFCRKLLGYALGRGVQLSDEPLLEEMQQRLAANGYRFSVAVETIVRSRPFREIRGQDTAVLDIP